MAKTYLLDTHAFLWWANATPALGKKAAKIIAAPSSEILVSHVSAWEMAIKVNSGKLTLPQPVAEFFHLQLSVNQFKSLLIRLGHVAAVATLSLHHRDPFDRMLIAQAMQENLPIISADPQFDAYDVTRIWE